MTTVVTVLLMFGLYGCGDSGSRDATEPTRSAPSDELAAHAGQVCPNSLPKAEISTYGFGTSEGAGSTPALQEPESAWICKYDATEDGPGPGGNGTSVGWVRSGGVRSVDPTRLPGLVRQLDGLVPASTTRACKSDLGPRFMLVYTHGTDLTGVVVDDFSCGDVRLTDDPFETVAGDPPHAADGPSGVVAGVLAAPRGLKDELKAAFAHS